MVRVDDPVFVGVDQDGGDGSIVGGVTGTVAWASVKVFSGKWASLIGPSESEPANAPIPITLDGVSA